MTSLKRTARIAGLWYLGFTLGPFYLLYVPSQTVVHDDAGATAARVLSHETLYRWGMLAETLGAVIFIGLGLALYRLFEDVDRHRARQLMALVLVSSALGLVTVDTSPRRSEEHTSELQSRLHLVCRLLLEKKKQ